MLTPAAVLGVIAGAFVEPPLAPPRAVAFDKPASRALLAMPALRAGGIAMAKMVHSSPHGLDSHIMAYDERGGLVAIVEGHRLTALRTAAASVLAARTLGARSARRLAVLGAGRQARAHIEAYADALPIESLGVWARRPEAARELAAFAKGHIATVRVAERPAEAAADADIVVCATPSTLPLVTGDMIGRGHVDLVGGFRPEMREADNGLIARAAIVADTAAALTEAGDLVQPLAAGVISPDRVLLLGDILSGSVRAPAGELTVFKSVGHAAEDLVVLELLLSRLGLRSDEAAPHNTLTKVARHA